MIALESFPAFRAAQMAWDVVIRKPEYRNESKRVQNAELKALADAFDNVVATAALWQLQVYELSGTKVRADESLGPQLMRMLHWVLRTYFPDAHKEYPGGTFDGKPHEVPCWAEDHESYAHYTGGLKVSDYFWMIMVRATHARLRLLAERSFKKAARNRFLDAYRRFWTWMKDEQDKAEGQHAVDKSIRQEERQASTAGWDARREASRESRAIRGRPERRLPSARSLRGQAFITPFSRPETEEEDDES
jgi:hypothetical protein